MVKPYEWMVKYTPQTEWISGRGLLFWLAFFFIELGAGMFIISSIFDVLTGQMIGWLLCALLGGGWHLLFLGRPFRFFRMVVKPQTSWISRGLIFVSLFLILGVVQMAMSLRATPPVALLVATNILAFLSVIYGGFAMCSVRGISLWNTPILPIMYVVAGILGGVELTMAVILGSGGILEVGVTVEEVSRILLLSFVIIIGSYLIGVRYNSTTGAKAVIEIVLGQGKVLFWVIVVIIGILLPVGVAISSFATGLKGAPESIIWTSIFAGIVGDLMLRYLILRYGFYAPLVPSSHI
ncbi:NrfD/PsrC family molybdoenzyme membrane anchor subunit [Chloroflexota bacterium]